MKLKTLLTLILFLVSVTCTQAQDVLNTLPCDDYDAITFNGKTIEQLNVTNAEPQNVQQLLGNYSSADELGENRSRAFTYGDKPLPPDEEPCGELGDDGCKEEPKDCMGVEGGKAYLGSCGNCVGGTSGFQSGSAESDFL